ncbi:hypothetical protein VMCG_09757 [Cytospora schulzeri]|uniref:Uncharacterized protein n=1 Tax=Cytospora schulzeri TaxID=448051 RepID=A0A423VGP3_9PEZI|nr:hypothetical protein VMCG_09757 [Valsa malicola]
MNKGCLALSEKSQGLTFLAMDRSNKYFVDILKLRMGQREDFVLDRMSSTDSRASSAGTIAGLLDRFEALDVSEPSQYSLDAPGVQMPAEAKNVDANVTFESWKKESWKEDLD